MYSSFTKTQSFPLVFVRPSMFKQIYTLKPQSLLKSVNLVGGFSSSIQESHCFNDLGSFGMLRTLPSGFCVKNAILNRKFVVARGLSSSSSQRIGEGRRRKRLALLKEERYGEGMRGKSVVSANANNSPWEVSVEKFLKEVPPPVEGEEVSRSRSRHRDGDGGGDGKKSWMKNVVTENVMKSPWVAPAEKYSRRASPSVEGEEVYRSRSRHSSYRDGDGGDGSKKTWLKDEKSREVRRNKSVVTENVNKSPWEVSAEKYLKGASPSVEGEEVSRSRSRHNSYRDGDDGGDDSQETLPWLAKEKSVVTTTATQSPREVSVEHVEGIPAEDEEVYRPRSRHTSYRDRDSYKDGDGGSEEGGEEEEEDFEDPRWDKIKTRFNMEVEARPEKEKPELRRWNKQENWGKKTWKEASESTLPKFSGEAIYGVGPVLAALCAGRRELYALYVQGGLDFSGNNRKKKDKKGVEKILRMAEKLGLNKNEVSKHDLNMVSDNRPHQGLVLDASPLEMVGIKELEPISVDEQNTPLWVALDEVTDPQNLGAIIRSSYFFGASGVVLCAKNSAPLSGVVSKASAGSLELVELRSCKNMMQFLTSSAENGWRVIGGSVSSRAVPLDEISPGAPTILVLGSEGTGLRPLVERSCSQLVKIPGNTPPNLIVGADEETQSSEAGAQHQEQDFRSFIAVESLNVSVAAGVLLHHFIGLNYRHNNPIQETK